MSDLLENDRYITWTGVWVGGSLGLYYIGGVKGLSWTTPLWWGGLGAGYLIAFVMGPRESSKSREYYEAVGELSETNYGGL